jgi:pimeloyl-ACP methyl ester carboxylesterase
MQDWDMQTVLDDLEYIKSQIQAARPGQKPVVGGYSLGAMLSTAAINATPADYRGVILWEESIYTDDAAIQALNQPLCDYWQNQLAQGAYYDTGAQGFRALAGLALTQPNDPTPAPGFPPGTTNRQAFIMVLTSSFPGPFSQPTPWFVLAAGDPQSATLFFANVERVARNALTFVDYTPSVLGRDLSCGLAGERTYTGQLSAYTGPIYVMQAGRGAGDIVTETALATGSNDIRYNRVDVFGHVDHWATDAHRHFVEVPLLNWLDTAAFR